MERRPQLLLWSAAILSLLLSGVAFAHSEKAAPKKGEAKTEAKPATDAKAAPADAKAAHDQMMAEMMKLAKPGPEHAALNPFIGTWKASTKMWMAPGEPQVSEGTCERAWAMGGRFVICSHKGNMMGMPFEGMEIMGYDNMKKQYVSSWIDNMGTGIALGEGGSMDPTTKTLTMMMSMTDPAGNKVPYRMSTKFVDDNTHVFTMYATRDGKEVPEMEVTYTRIK